MATGQFMLILNVYLNWVEHINIYSRKD